MGALYLEYTSTELSPAFVVTPKTKSICIESIDLVMAMDDFTRQVIDIIRNIPPGKVTTYGIVALAAGNHSGARQVARILYSSSKKYNLPWHRVVNQKRAISPRPSMSHLKQYELLEEEGIVFDEQEKIDFSRFLWMP